MTIFDKTIILILLAIKLFVWAKIISDAIKNP